MFIIFAMPRTNEGDYLHRSLKNCCGVEPQQFLAKNFTQAHNYPKRKWQHRHTFLNSTFAIVLSFFIGLTTANFGALVRYRIPLLPFFVFMLLYVYETKRKRKMLND